jgi:hypothetical protein
MFGYATDETEECMPLTVVLAHQEQRTLSSSSDHLTSPPLPPSFRPVTFFIGYRYSLLSALVKFTLHPNLLSKPVSIKCRRWQIPNFLFGKGSGSSDPKSKDLGVVLIDQLLLRFCKNKICKTSCSFMFLVWKIGSASV